MMPKNTQPPSSPPSPSKKPALAAADLFDDFEDENPATTAVPDDQSLEASFSNSYYPLSSTQVEDEEAEMIAQLVRDGLIPPQPPATQQPSRHSLSPTETVLPSGLLVSPIISPDEVAATRSRSNVVKSKSPQAQADPELRGELKPAPLLAQFQPQLDETSLPAAAPASSQAQAASQSRVMAVTLDQIIFSNLNPRSNAGSDLNEIKQSFGTGAQPLLAQLPTGELLSDGRVRVLSGERRVRAIQESGKWSVLEMVVRPASALSRSQAHTFRLVENLHRQPLNQFDEAAALKISYLLANAQALGVASDADRLLTQAEENGSRPALVLRELEQLMEALPSWTPTRPPVTWDTVLDGLGIELEPSRRRQKLRVLEVKAELHPTLAGLAEPLSEVALRELGRLGEADQAQLVEAVVRDPARLSDKVVPIVKMVKEKGWSVEQALTHLLNPPTATATAGVSSEPLKSNSPISNNSRVSSGFGSSDEASSTTPRPSGSRGRGRGSGGGGSGIGRGDGYDNGNDYDYEGGEGSLEGGYGGLSLEGLPEELPPQVADRVEALQNRGVVKLSEPALHSLAQLTPEKQHQLLDILEEQPHLAAKLVRIIKIVRDNNWSIETVIAEFTQAKGENEAEAEAETDGPSVSGMEHLKERMGLDQSWSEGEGKDENEQTQENEDAATELMFEPEEEGAAYFESEYDLQSLELSPAIRRALASLEPQLREQLLGVLVEHPHIKNKVRRMVSLLKAGATLEEVTDEALGYVGGQPIDAQLLEDGELLGSATPDTRTQEEKLADGTKHILDAISELTDGLDILKALSPSGKLGDLPDPWNAYTVETLGMAVQAMREVGLEV